MRHIFVILSILALESVRGGDNGVVPDFSSYPQTPAFKDYLLTNTNAALHLGQKNLLVISEFPTAGRGAALEYFVSESGKARSQWDCFDWAIQGTQRKQLSETNLASLRAAIRALPAQSVAPPLERLIIVSFREGSNWITRSFDTATLPEPMRQIYRIIGERRRTRSI